MEPLLDRLRRGEVVLGDGAWGTMLLSRGLPTGDAPERLNLTRPGLLTEIAAQYLAAGAEIVTTNTFGASPPRLRAHGLEGRVSEVCENGVRAARRAAGADAYVSGSVGPTGLFLAPFGDSEPEVVSEAFESQVAALARAGADLICVETMTDLAEAKLAVRAARSVAPRLTVLATMTFEVTPRGIFTMMGVPVDRAARGLAEAGADVVGANCGNGSEEMVAIARELGGKSSVPFAVRPNAGRPTLRGGALVYPETPEILAARAPELLAAGASILGGCCGTTPEHVRALRQVLDDRRG